MKQFLKGLFEGLHFVGLVVLGRILSTKFEISDWHLWVIALIYLITNIYWYIKGRDSKNE